MNTIEDNDSRTKYFCKCKKCKEQFTYESDECFWDEKSISGSTKLVKCKHCGCINVVKYIEDYGFSIINVDERLYDYTK